MAKPQITIKNMAQKGSYKFSDILNKNILSDVCKHLTGQKDYTVVYDNNGYNKGRLAIIEYNDTIYYVSFSEHGKVEGRNSFFQSLTTAFISYSSELRTKKRMIFYFLPSITGNFDGAYFQFMYRLMSTIGVEFINAEKYLGCSTDAFINIGDLINSRRLNRSRNITNNSTYITYNAKNIIQIYGKTYGANKKEAILLSLAASRLVKNVQLFEICEQDLTCLPTPDKNILEQIGNIQIISTNKTMERKALLETEKTFRSPTFIYNLFNKFQEKECAFCDCRISEIIAGAHIWSVSDIKKADELTDEEKLEKSTDADNGLWLCYNHHKMFDENILRITNSGEITYSDRLNNEYRSFISKTTTKEKIPDFAFTPIFAQYLKLRNESFNSYQFA